MGSSYKLSSSSSSSSSRGKAYALMVLVAFGAAIVGVMVLHKLREKRVFGLLLKQKDHDLLTLHLLFQREQEFNKEARKKIEDMKTKVYSLRSHKLELDRRLLEMESTIASLRDERHVIESTLEEKKNEIKMLMEEGINSTLPRLSALQDLIKLKDAEIQRLQLRINSTRGIVQQHEEQMMNVSEESDDLDENQLKEKDGIQNISILNVTEAKIGDNARDQETRESIHTSRSGLKLEESHLGVNGSASRTRRKHSRRTRLRDVRNRRSEERQSKQGGPMEVHQAPSNKTQDTGREDRGSMETKAKGFEEAENGDKGSYVSKEEYRNGNGKTGLEKQIDEEKKSQPEIDANRKLLKMHGNSNSTSTSTDMKKYEDDNEKGKEVEVEEGEEERGEADDLGDTLEPEINRADIQRFTESDVDEEEEEVEDAAQEPEF